MGKPSIAQVILRIVTIIAAVEFVIMMILLNFPVKISAIVEAWLDVSLLVVLSTPIIYLWIIKPYVRAHDKVVDYVNHMANHDPLTELPNRRLLLEHLKKMASRLAREKLYGAILLIDLDGFKLINDKYGHDAGDALLMELAKRLIFFARAEDIVSRIGGDEFVLAFGHIGENEEDALRDALQISERIHEKICEEVQYKGKTLTVGASIGIRLLKPEKIDIELALKDADIAMYNSKSSSKESVTVSRAS